MFMLKESLSDRYVCVELITCKLSTCRRNFISIEIHARDLQLAAVKF